MSNGFRAFVVICDRAHCSYPVAAFTSRDPAELYAGWCNRGGAVYGQYRVVDVPLNNTTPAMRAAAVAQEKARTF